MPSEDNSRKQGVEFGSLAEDLESEEYPIDSEELLDTYGDREIELQDGNQTLQEILGPLEEATFDSAEDVMQRTIGMVSEEAIGRKGYTDRGGMSSEDERSDESM